MPAENRTYPNPSPYKLEEAIRLAKSGRKAEASQTFRQIVALQPVNLAAWLWLSAVTEDPAEAEAALEQARKINPTHHSLPRAEQWLVHRFSAAPATRQNPVSQQTRPTPAPSVPTPEATPSPQRLWKLSHSVGFTLVLLAALLGLLVLVIGLILEISSTAKASDERPYLAQETGQPVAEPAAETLAALEASWSRQEWARAIAILEPLYEARPEDQTLRDRLAQAYLHQALNLRSRGFVEEARSKFEQALSLDPGQATAQQELRLASAYLNGTRHYQAGNWLKAITALEQVWAEESGYIHTRELLYSAYYNQALAHQAAGQFYKARRAIASAITLRPDLSEAHRVLAEVEFALAPQTPPAVPVRTSSVKDKFMVVGIAEQRMWVFEQGRQIFDFVISTGEPGRETVPGDFEILNKIDVAYAATWNLDMPYWMGIYWAGHLQNGIHALPIVKHTGYKLWDGYLGQRVSYGCVILSDEDAATLYNWAEVGTKIKIVPSLAYWSPNELDTSKPQP